jgi:hypothetical protein
MGSSVAKNFNFLVTSFIVGKEAPAIDQKKCGGIERIFGHLKKNGFDLEADPHHEGSQA